MRVRSLAAPTAALCALTVLAAPAAFSPAAAAPGAVPSASTGVVRAPDTVVGGPDVARLPRGTLLSKRRITGVPGLPSAMRSYRVRYVSVGARDQLVVVSGTVSLPRAEAPRRTPWRVLSWVHGTTGLADVCAPSRDREDGPVHDYLGPVDEVLDQWSQRGYVVAKSDLEGLGTPGDHPYLNGPSARRAATDIVLAARQLDRRVGRRWLVAGHSQGGHAAVATAAGPTRFRGLELVGAVAIAPGGVGLDQTAPYIMNDLPGAQAAIAFLPPLLVGAAAADPAVVPEALLSDEAEVLLEAAATGCLAAIREAAETLTPSQVFDPEADLEPLSAYLRTQDPAFMRVGVPTLVQQGTADTLVGKPGIDHLVSQLCPEAPALEYQVYDGADHRSVVPAGLADALRFAGDRFEGAEPTGTC